MYTYVYRYRYSMYMDIDIGIGKAMDIGKDLYRVKYVQLHK